MNPVLATLGRRLRLGLVGGSRGFIGPVHRTAARLDDLWELAAGVLSSDPERCRAAGSAIGLAPDRCYPDLPTMLAVERRRPDGIEAVAISTPNADHVPQAKAALEAGLDVICDKPLAADLAGALELVATVRRTGRLFVLTYNYSAYPMVHQARAMVRAGVLGAVRQIHLTYVQGHHATLVEATPEGFSWRFDPTRCGSSLVLGDIGTHAHHLGAFVSGLELEAVVADVRATVPGRTVDDTACLLCRWSGGAVGTLWVTEAAAGAEHGLAFRIIGAEGDLEWHQERPNELRHRRLGGFEEVLTRRHTGLAPDAARLVRVVRGHPEGYQEAFANLYRDAALAILARRGLADPPPPATLPTVEDGARGMAMIEAALESMRHGRWVDCRLVL
ncbi:MAG: Gfo/Idh/MocA family oxidoreductase [Geminicoccaceae bacterium]|nr:Gfo/Idh/MocA family oxidoreductase [Geminicoccaceae bacterium]MDW8370083.1 Gfo/Idh/MocA family oxidoreductase [Geminicoccaceae bacterium]